MQTEWDYVAQSVLDQLGPHDRALVVAAVERACADWDAAPLLRVVVPGPGGGTEYVLQAGAEFRVFVSRSPDRLTVLDVVPRKQIAALLPEEPARLGGHA